MSDPYNPPTAPPPPGGPPAYAAPGLPWDRERSGGAFLNTLKRLTTSPVRAFAEMREKGDYAAPILFAVILGTLGTVVNQIWALVWGVSGLEDYPPQLIEILSRFGDPLMVMVIGNILLTPILIPIGLFIGSAITHLILMLVGGTRDSIAGFEGTLRVLGYTSIANLAMFLPHPYLGGVVAAVWTIVLAIIGLREAHHTSTGRAVAAVLLLPVLCCACLILVVLVAGLMTGMAMTEFFR